MTTTNDELNRAGVDADRRCGRRVQITVPARLDDRLLDYAAAHGTEWNAAAIQLIEMALTQVDLLGSLSANSAGPAKAEGPSSTSGVPPVGEGAKSPFPSGFGKRRVVQNQPPADWRERILELVSDP